jgi:hypothetical protein
MSRKPCVIKHTGELVLIALAVALSLLGLVSAQTPNSVAVKPARPISYMLVSYQSKQVVVHETAADHWRHEHHLAHLSYLRNHRPVTATLTSYSPGGFPSYGTYSFSQLEEVWDWAGGPSADAWSAATIAECESGGRTNAYNPSGASGLWQILGVPFSGNPMDGPTNARMAVAKFRDAGGFGPWVCRA